MQINSRFIRLTKRAGVHQAISIILITASVVIAFSPVAMAADLGLIDAVTLSRNPSKWVVLDARPKADWEAGHIPGALPFSWEALTHTDPLGVKYSSLPPQDLALALSGLGIDEKTPVVVYGDADKSWGSEGYALWLFSWLGHKGPVRLVTGGIQGWRSRNLPLTTAVTRPLARKGRYLVNLKPQFLVSTEELQRGKDAFALVDVRSTFEWFKGRIPGAIHIPWDDFYTGDDHHPLSPTDLRKLLAKNGVSTSKPVVFYCLGGVRSAYAWSVSQLAGLPDVRNYKGSWAAWEKRAGQ